MHARELAQQMVFAGSGPPMHRVAYSSQASLPAVNGNGHSGPPGIDFVNGQDVEDARRNGGVAEVRDASSGRTAHSAVLEPRNAPRGLPG